MGSCEDPAGRDQTSPAAENLLLGFTAPKYGSDPRVGFHSGNCSTHDLHVLSPGALAACQLCSWGFKNQVENSCGEKKNMKTGYDEFSEAVKSPGSGSVGAGEGGAGTTRLESFSH